MMDSESSQDAYFYLEHGENYLVAYTEDEMLAFEETKDSTMENQHQDIKQESIATTTKEHNFTLQMSFSPGGHSLSGYEPEEESMHPVCASTPQPHQLEYMDNFEPPGVDFVIENGFALSLSDISMPSPKVVLSQAGDFVGDIQEGTVMSPCEVSDMALVSKAAQEGGDTNAFQRTNGIIPSESSQSPREPLPDVRQYLQLFNNEQMVFQAISIREINHTPEINQQDFSFNGVDVAGQLLEAAAAQMERNVIVNESTLMAIANGLEVSIECGTGEHNPMIVQRGIGPMVADILLDSQTGMVLGFAVARLVPRPIVNSSGSVQGSVIHQVTRGFAIDDNARRIITEGVGTAIWVVNQPSPSSE